MNALLENFPNAIQQRLLGVTKEMDLPSRTVLYKADGSARYVYFLNSGVASIVVNMEEGESA